MRSVLFFCARVCLCVGDCLGKPFADMKGSSWTMLRPCSEPSATHKLVIAFAKMAV